MAFPTLLRAFLLLLLAVLPLATAGCGEDAAPPEDTAPDGAGTPEEGAWSDASAGEQAAGSPDGDGPATAEALGARLRERVTSGRGLADPAYERDVRDVAEVLWPSDGTVQERAGAQVHVQLSAIAAQVGGWLAEGETARAERAKSDPVDLEIHDAWLSALAGGPEAYRVWCEEAGAKLLEKLAEARRARFFPPR